MGKLTKFQDVLGLITAAIALALTANQLIPYLSPTLKGIPEDISVDLITLALPLIIWMVFILRASKFGKRNIPPKILVLSCTVLAIGCILIATGISHIVSRSGIAGLPSFYASFLNGFNHDIGLHIFGPAIFIFLCLFLIYIFGIFSQSERGIFYWLAVFGNMFLRTFIDFAAYFGLLTFLKNISDSVIVSKLNSSGALFIAVIILCGWEVLKIYLPTSIPLQPDDLERIRDIQKKYNFYGRTLKTPDSAVHEAIAELKRQLDTGWNPNPSMSQQFPRTRILPPQ